MGEDTRKGRIYRSRAARAGLIAVASGGAVALGTIPTTLVDFFQPGSQPGSLGDPMASVQECQVCHGNFNIATEPFRPWSASMMGQAARDPLMYAALAIANNDAAFAGDMCLRCHAPMGWIDGRSSPEDGSALTGTDFEGVGCNFCHRMVDPTNMAGSPAEDPDILASVGTLPPDAHSGNYIIDPIDRRRGPYDLGPNFPPFHEWRQSPFHTTARLCATCHDVSNPIYDRQPNGTYTLGPLNQPQVSGSKFDQFPVERTYSEWSASAFGAGPVDVGGRFGGNLTAVSTCQDCHMPPTTGYGCRVGELRTNLPTHYFNGGNTWVVKAVRNLYPDSETLLTDASVSDSITRAYDMLDKASDMQLSFANGQLRVRVINQTGHKLPSGYPEGRRIWINVRFFNAAAQLIAERGAYNPTTGVLTTGDTKVYEAQLGVDAAVSALTGVPVGPSFHFALNNTWYMDNRIPPRGFTNAGFAAVQAAPVGYTYADGQYWDDTLYAIPAGAVSATATVYYQTSSKEYMEFLRDNQPVGSTAGQTAYDQWVATGRSTPVVMDAGAINLTCYPNCDGSTTPPVLNVLDFGCFLNKFAAGDPYANCDGSTTPPVLNVLDFGCFLNKFAAGCT